VADLTKGTRISGPDREGLTAEFVKRYAGGESIRDLARSSGRSYGFVHRLLSEAGQPMRGRGGATRASKRT